MRRLRDLLGSPDTVKQQDGKLSLNPQQCWVDALALARLLRKSPAGNSACATMFSLYQGQFLPEDESKHWSFGLRNRLHRDFVVLVNRSAQQLERANEWEAAIETYRQGLERDGGTESFYQGLVRCHRALGREVVATAMLRHMESARKADSTSQSSATTKAVRKKIFDR